MEEQGTRKYKSYQLCSNVEKDTAKAEGLDAALASSLHRRRAKPSVYSVCELVHKIVQGHKSAYLIG